MEQMLQILTRIVEDLNDRRILNEVLQGRDICPLQAIKRPDTAATAELNEPKLRTIRALPDEFRIQRKQTLCLAHRAGRLQFRCRTNQITHAFWDS